MFSLVHRQLQGEGRLSVPVLARALGVSEGAVLHALTELYHRGWLELVPDAPYFRIPIEGRSAWRP